MTKEELAEFKIKNEIYASKVDKAFDQLSKLGVIIANAEVSMKNCPLPEVVKQWETVIRDGVKTKADLEKDLDHGINVLKINEKFIQKVEQEIK